MRSNHWQRDSVRRSALSICLHPTMRFDLDAEPSRWFGVIIAVSMFRVTAGLNPTLAGAINISVLRANAARSGFTDSDPEAMSRSIREAVHTELSAVAGIWTQSIRGFRGATTRK